MIYLRVMSEEPIDYEAVRRRFPWVGLANTGETDLSSRYREIMAQGHRGRQIIEATGSIRRST